MDFWSATPLVLHSKSPTLTFSQAAGGLAQSANSAKQVNSWRQDKGKENEGGSDQGGRGKGEGE